jgi:hypothetical protein
MKVANGTEYLLPTSGQAGIIKASGESAENSLIVHRENANE